MSCKLESSTQAGENPIKTQMRARSKYRAQQILLPYNPITHGKRRSSFTHTDTKLTTNAKIRPTDLFNFQNAAAGRAIQVNHDFRSKKIRDCFAIFNDEILTELRANHFPERVFQKFT